MSYNHQAVFILLFVTFTCLFKSTSTEYLRVKPWKDTERTKQTNSPALKELPEAFTCFNILPLCSLCTCMNQSYWSWRLQRALLVCALNRSQVASCTLTYNQMLFLTEDLVSSLKFPLSFRTVTWFERAAYWLTLPMKT